MIKFFRRLRQNLLSEGNVRKYLVYAIGEIILVVLGIMIALQLNSNAENKKLNDRKQKYALQLIEDLQREIQVFEEFRKAVQKDEEAYKQYLKIYENTDLQPNEVYDELFKLRMYSNTIIFNTSTIESLRSSGELILFSFEVRNKLMDLLRTQDDVIRQKTANNDGKNALLMHLGRIRGSSGLINKLEGHSALKEYLNIDRNMPDIILALDAAHKWKNVSETQTLKDLELMKINMEEIIELIKKEL